MLDRTRQDHQDEQYVMSPDNEVAVALQSLVMAAGQLEAMSHEAKYRDIMAQDSHSVQISSARLALKIISERVGAREVA